MRAFLILVPFLLLVPSLLFAVPGGVRASEGPRPPVGPPDGAGMPPTIHCELPGSDAVAVTSLAFAPDGRTLAAGNSAGEVLYFDPTTAEQRARFQVLGRA